MEGFAAILGAVMWPVVVLTVFLLFRRPLNELLARVLRIKAGSKGVDLILRELEREQQLPFGSRSELAGLTAHDIWALDSFADKAMPPGTDLTPAQRVAARTLRDVGLITIEGEGAARKVALTELGQEVLRIAKGLL